MNRSGPIERRTPLQATTGLQRGAPMARGEGPQRTTRLRLGQDRNRAQKDVYAAAKAAIWTRCGGACECCGDRLDPDAWQAHHRQLRSRGGQDTPANLVAVDGDCHTAGPWAIHREPTWAEKRGLMVPSWDDPEAAPLWLPYKRRVLLQPDGTYLDMPVLP